MVAWTTKYAVMIAPPKACCLLRALPSRDGSTTAGESRHRVDEFVPFQGEWPLLVGAFEVGICAHLDFERNSPVRFVDRVPTEVRDGALHNRLVFVDGAVRATIRCEPRN